MVYESDIVGKFVTLRSITVEDAEFSYNLRMDPRFVDIMGQPAESLEAQRRFIEWQRREPGDYYFVVLNKQKEKIGLIGVYKIHGDCGEAGRELNIGTPWETMEAERLLFDFCDKVLELKSYTSIVYKQNRKQFNMLKKRGYDSITEIEHNGIPSYLLEASIESHRVWFTQIKEMINKLSS